MKPPGPDDILAGLVTSKGPRTDLAESLAMFAPLIGSWHLDVRTIDADGHETVQEGEWHFGWALDGRAVADVWIVPSRRIRALTGADDQGEWGMTVRFPSKQAGTWLSTWLGPRNSTAITFTASKRGDDIILEGPAGDPPYRWIFSDITPDTFSWRAEQDATGGTVILQRFDASRPRPGDTP